MNLIEKSIVTIDQPLYKDIQNENLNYVQNL